MGSTEAHRFQTMAASTQMEEVIQNTGSHDPVPSRIWPVSHSPIIPGTLPTMLLTPKNTPTERERQRERERERDVR